MIEQSLRLAAGIALCVLILVSLWDICAGRELSVVSAMHELLEKE